jgi:CubicO group peptidase (beta-lactamase class C family)
MLPITRRCHAVRPLFTVLLLLACSTAVASPIAAKAAPGPAERSGPVFSNTGFAGATYGEAEGYPIPKIGERRTARTDVGYYSHFDRVRSVDAVKTAGAPSALKWADRAIAPVYPYNDQIRSIGSYLDRNPVTGLLIARNDTILYEHYQYGRTDHDRFMSQSMAKTIVGMLVGIAVSEGAIRSIDDSAATYVPELSGNIYGDTSIRNLLHMSSGAAYHENSTPNDDTVKLGHDLFPARAPGAITAIRKYNKRDKPPGTRFNYASVETEVLGLVVSHAVHMPLAVYASSRIWQKMGMEQDASWGRDPTGEAIAYCCFSATLRDWARLGLMLAHDGAWNGRQIVPRQWVIDSTTVPSDRPYLSPGKATRLLGYGYQTWLLPGQGRMFAFQGMDGQRILVDPASKLVLVQTAVWTDDHDPGMREVFALWNAIVTQYGQRT